MADLRSAFTQLGFRETIDSLKQQVRDLYTSDSIPWVIGYSGGKDSTAVLQLVWLALEDMEKDALTKPIHVISTDTLVENPVVAAWVTASLNKMSEAAERSHLPLTSHRLTPEITDTFWVNLIGRGYPAPRPKFRWCTERMKINPSNAFIRNVVRKSGEAILLLGTRKAESTVRAKGMKRLEKKRVRDLLSPNASLPNSLVYTPIQSWTNDDVWTFLMQATNPWGYNNKDLLTMYQGASPDGECPLVIDTTTPSCGDSRFGCWVCTLVDKDKSMHAMIQNDEEKEWMLPLLELRNELDVPSDRHLRDFRRMHGGVQLFHDDPIPGPYTQESRARWLKKLLEAQEWIRNNGPDYVREIELIRLEEIQEIRRIWVVDKHEMEDALPSIFEEVTGRKYPGPPIDENPIFGAEEMEILREVCEGDELHYQLNRELLDVERRHRFMVRRAGLFDALESSFKRNFYDDEDDAVDRARRKKDAVDERIQKSDDQLTLLDYTSQQDPVVNDS